jgi:negative regulator of genetic competence, sporulation and motility
MELIRINDRKIKIMLTSSDMKNYALDPGALSCGNEETRQAFRNILHDAGVGGGFEVGADKIYVQYYPSREGGCEMFVTRLALVAGDAQAARDQSGAATVAQLQALPIANVKHRVATPSLFAYRFETLSLLLHACHLLEQMMTSLRHKPSSAAFRDDCGKFYLTLDLTPLSEGDGDELPYVAFVLGEFGTACPAKDLRAYIAEHATPLCRTRAVETLGAL